MRNSNKNKSADQKKKYTGKQKFNLIVISILILFFILTSTITFF